jgi:hypothetical protein
MHKLNSRKKLQTVKYQNKTSLMIFFLKTVGQDPTASLKSENDLGTQAMVPY